MTGKAAQLRTIDDASPAGEGGLLGLAVTADEQTVFAYFTAAQDNRIVSMSWDGTTLGEPKPILTGIPKGGRHNGGRMVVGPDGDLYVGTGETGDTDLAQDKTSLGGKILRITTDGKPAAGNPFSNEVYSYGHRNVEGLAFDAQGRLWASEFGEQTWDELNLITKGGNYGWPEVEGSGEAAGMINPKVVWSTAEASPAGLAFWRGSLWMAALRGARLWQIPVDGEDTGTPVAHFTQRYGRIRSVIVSADGSALLVTNSNTDGRGDPARRRRPAPGTHRLAGPALTRVPRAAEALRPVGQLLERPGVAVGVGEEDERTPGHDVDITHRDAATGQLGPRRFGVGDHHLQVVERAGRHLGQSLADRDRAGRARRGQLNEADVLIDDVVEVGDETDLVDVESLGPVDVADRHGDELEFEVHDQQARSRH